MYKPFLQGSAVFAPVTRISSPLPRHPLSSRVCRVILPPSSFKPQGRTPFSCFSSALDESYLWAAIHYVERNPVRARMVRGAENYRWSSAAAPCGLRADSVLTKEPGWMRQLNSVGDWSKWLAQGDRPEQLEGLRRHVERDCHGGRRNSSVEKEV